MGLLAPALLGLLAAVAVPLLLHLLHRHQGPRVVFPALRYLRRAEREHARQIRIKQVLLLALRIAAVVLLALAAARPFLRFAGAEHRPTDVVMVLDNSLSTGAVVDGRRVLQTLRDRALAALADARPDDRFWLLRAAEPWLPARTGSAAEIAAAVRATDVGGAADVAEAVRRGRQILAGLPPGRAREVQVLTDGQASGFPASSSPGAGAAAGPGTGTAAAPGAGAEDDLAPVLVALPDRPPPPNAGVTAVQVGGGLAPRPGERAAVTGTVGGQADFAAVRLVVGGRPVAAASAGADGAFALTLPVGGAGRVSGWVEIGADALRADNRRYFTFSVAPPPTVAVAGPASFVEAAAEVLDRAKRLALAPAAAADVVVAPAGVGATEAGRGAAVVVLPPDSASALPAANRRLEAAGIPWRYGAAVGGGDASLRVPEGDRDLAAALADARVRTSYRLDPVGDARPDTVLLRLSDGSPWLVRAAGPGGAPVLLLASPLSPDAGTIPTSEALLPLLDRITGEWAPARKAVASLVVGDAPSLPVGTTALVSESDTVRVEAGVAPRLLEPGLYRVVTEAGDSGVVAVNAPAAETPLARVSESQLRQRLAGDVRVSDDAGGWRRAIFRSRLGYEVAPVLLLLALAVLAAEMLLAASGRGAAPRAPRIEAKPEPNA